MECLFVDPLVNRHVWVSSLKARIRLFENLKHQHDTHFRSSFDVLIN
jgi:hypothetical protein